MFKNGGHSRTDFVFLLTGKLVTLKLKVLKWLKLKYKIRVNLYIVTDCM